MSLFRLDLVNTIGARDTSTDRDEKIVNGYAEIDSQRHAVKRPAVAGAYSTGTGHSSASFMGQGLFSWGSATALSSASSGNSGGFVAIRGDTLDTSPQKRRSYCAFTVQPSSTGPGLAMSPSPVVKVYDAMGSVLTSYSGNVTITLGPSNPNNGLLSGTTTVAASSGVATFSNLIIDKLGSYTFIASAV